MLLRFPHTDAYSRASSGAVLEAGMRLSSLNVIQNPPFAPVLIS